MALVLMEAGQWVQVGTNTDPTKMAMDTTDTITRTAHVILLMVATGTVYLRRRLQKSADRYGDKTETSAPTQGYPHDHHQQTTHPVMVETAQMAIGHVHGISIVEGTHLVLEQVYRTETHTYPATMADAMIDHELSETSGRTGTEKIATTALRETETTERGIADATSLDIMIGIVRVRDWIMMRGVGVEERAVAARVRFVSGA